MDSPRSWLSRIRYTPEEYIADAVEAVVVVENHGARLKLPVSWLHPYGPAPPHYPVGDVPPVALWAPLIEGGAGVHHGVAVPPWRVPQRIAMYKQLMRMRRHLIVLEDTYEWLL